MAVSSIQVPSEAPCGTQQSYVLRIQIREGDMQPSSMNALPILPIIRAFCFGLSGTVLVVYEVYLCAASVC